MNMTITILFTLAYLAVTVYLCRGLTLKTRDLCVCGLSIALTLVLEALRLPLPTGSSIPLLSMLPLMVLSLYNYRLAMFGGFITGLMALLFVPGWQPVHWGQVFVEHLVCFSCIGYTGVFGTDSRKKLLAGVALASVLKLCGHTLSGVVFFSQNAWVGWGAWGYSLGYNLSQNVPLALLSAAVFFSIPKTTLCRITKGEA